MSKQEQTLLLHFENYLKTIVDPKRQLVLTRSLEHTAYIRLREFKRELAKKLYHQRKPEVELKKTKLQLLNKLILNSGDIIKVENTRDGGMREVISVDGKKVICYKLTGNRSLPWIRTYPTLKSYCRSGQKTRNDLSKVSHLAEDGRWRNLKKSVNPAD